MAPSNNESAPSPAIDLTILPVSIVTMLENSSPEVKPMLEQILNERGVQYVLDHLGHLKSQAEYIDSL